MQGKKHDHAVLIEKVMGEMPEAERLCDLAALFAAFGDTTRMRILYLLFESELCVCAISELLSMTQSAISHQLKVLRDFRLVGCRRQGKTVYYYLADDHVRVIISQAYKHLIREECNEHEENI
jgi:DNA-binding transcriptional ArsR family regulator